MKDLAGRLKGDWNDARPATIPVMRCTYRQITPRDAELPYTDTGKPMPRVSEHGSEGWLSKRSSTDKG